jgi:elongation factor Ts
MAEITSQLVKQLRERTGAGMMECKRALEESRGDIAEGEIILRKRGIAAASKRAARATRQGVIGTYIHPGSQLGVLVEVNCESDFVARTEEFQRLVHDVAMQIAALDPRFIRREDVSPEVLEQEREIQRARAIAEGKPPQVAEKIVDGRMTKYFEEVCLYEQPFIKEATTTIGQMVAATIAKTGENVGVSRFMRFKVGDTAGE